MTDGGGTKNHQQRTQLSIVTIINMMCVCQHVGSQKPAHCFRLAGLSHTNIYTKIIYSAIRLSNSVAADCQPAASPSTINTKCVCVCVAPVGKTAK